MDKEIEDLIIRLSQITDDRKIISRIVKAFEAGNKEEVEALIAGIKRKTKGFGTRDIDAVDS